MFRLTIALLVVTAVSGCTRRQQDFAWFAAAVALEVAHHASEHERRDGVAVAAPAEPDPGPSPVDAERARGVALELTKIAAHDARIDNCAAVARTSEHVRLIDSGVFAHVFLRDVPIQRCLALVP